MRGMVGSLVAFLLLLGAASVPAIGQGATTQDGIRDVMQRTADWQIRQIGAKAPVDWQHAAFYAGLAALAGASENGKYWDYLQSVGDKNQWRLGPRPFHADDHCVGQTYLALHALRKDSKMVQPTKEGMDGLVKHLASEEKLTWDWCDALFMAPATLAKLSADTGDNKYLDAMDKEWWKTTDALYDKNEHLFYRDSRFLPQRTKNGKKVFWSRGNGWVLAGLARVLEVMPADYPTRSRYVEQFREMAKKVASLQCSDGLWRPSLLDPDDIAIGETSGSGFFCFAIAWGINNGLLDSAEYRPVVEKAWKALAACVNSDGRLGFVQPVGDRPGSLNANSTAPYGVGALLLAGCEMERLSGRKQTDGHKAADGAIEQVIRQFKEYILANSSADPKKAMELASSQSEDGSWRDIDYEFHLRSGWPASGHITRTLAMACVLASGKANPEQCAALESAIHKALSFWSKGDFKNDNWWHNEIGAPQQMGAACLLFGDRLKPEEFDYVTGTMMPRAKIGMTGQNRVWLAGNTLMNALLCHDEAKVKEAARVIFSEVKVTDEEGVQPDYSFHQHGPQLQFGNYGLAFSDEQLKWAAILRGTPWAMGDKKLAIMRDYLLNGQQWVVWRGAMDISSCGRQLSPGSPRGKCAGLLRQMTRLGVLDPGHAAEYAACVKRNSPKAGNDLIGARFFWRSDYLVDRRKDLCYTVKMCSKRVIGSESLNSENLSGYHLPDGATYIYCLGDEYEDIFPVWDWRRLPGVTCAQGEGPLPSFSRSQLDSDFVGGVCDGTNACAFLDYRRDGVSAKKAWFFAGDRMVCLGAAIRGDKSIATTVNQCRLRGDVKVNDGTATIVQKTGVHEYLGGAEWLEHDGIRYTFLQPEKVALSNQSVTGNWSKVRKTIETPKNDVSQDVFLLIIDHGTNPQGAGYAYCISPAGGRQEKPEVLANTEKLQAAGLGKVVEAVFYAPGDLAYMPGHSLTVRSPCVVVMDSSQKALRVTVADPTQTLKSISISLDGKVRDVSLPTGGKAGSSVTVDLNGK